MSVYVVEMAALPAATDAKFKIPADASIKNEAPTLEGVRIAGGVCGIYLTVNLVERALSLRCRLHDGVASRAEDERCLNFERCGLRWLTRTFFVDRVGHMTSLGECLAPSRLKLHAPYPHVPNSAMSKPGPKKRVKTSHYHDRIPLEDDFEVIHARSSHLTSRNEPVDSSRSPLKGRTTWTIGSFWAPDDDEELALDDTDDRYNEEIMAGIFDSRPTFLDPGRPTRKRRVRSRISVR